MAAIDLLIRGGTVVLPSGEKKISLAVDQGKVVGHGDTEAKQVIDAKDLLILPGALDPHVHFNEPGREDWEGWETGSRASRAGGATGVVEMPLNALPPTLDVDTFQKKKAVAEKSRSSISPSGAASPRSILINWRSWVAPASSASRPS